jgi:hypothetical protein
LFYCVDIQHVVFKCIYASHMGDSNHAKKLCKNNEKIRTFVG